MVKSFDKQVELICERAERRLSKQQAWIRWCPEVETQEEAAAPAQAAGAYDPEKQEANWIISRVPRKSYQRMTGSSLPARDKRAEELHELAESANKAPRFEGSYPSEPPPEKPQKRERLWYPDSGIV